MILYHQHDPNRPNMRIYMQVLVCSSAQVDKIWCSSGLDFIADFVTTELFKRDASNSKSFL